MQKYFFLSFTAYNCADDGHYDCHNYCDIDSIRVNNQKECQEKCQELDKCAYWSYNVGSKWCYRHDAKAAKRFGGGNFKRGSKYCPGKQY